MHKGKVSLLTYCLSWQWLGFNKQTYVMVYNALGSVLENELTDMLKKPKKKHGDTMNISPVETLKGVAAETSIHQHVNYIVFVYL